MSTNDTGPRHDAAPQGATEEEGASPRHGEGNAAPCIDLGDYTLTALLHSEPTTLVYRGFRNADRAPIVAKVLRAEQPAPRHVAELRHEHAILRDLDLPGVVRPLGLVRHESRLALLLEHFGGTTLAEALRGGKLALGTALTIAISLATTLEELHRRHVIHKDVKPHNILVDLGSLETRLISFAMAARLSHEYQRLASPDTLEGTPAYMSPEQTGRMPRLVDERSDLYSFGVTLYEMLTGTLPFTNTGALELIHSHMARVPTPPHVLCPEVPAPLSGVVMKLLAKTPEDRYQCAAGAKADLERCARALAATGQIAPFEIGAADFRSEVRIPQKLYGREAETEEVLGAWKRAAEGGVELLLVSGYSGVGKSALVHEIHRSIARQRGYFAGGKFDQLGRSVPYATVGRALQELARLVLTESREALSRWRSEIVAALGDDVGMLVDRVPELSLIVGPAAAAPVAAEASNRFIVVLQKLLRVFAAPAHPLALFFDDLQWADAASLKLLKLLLAAEDSANLLVIGAYRDAEVDPSHALALALGELREAGVSIREIALTPLGPDDVRALVADTLGCDPARSAPLAAMAHAKTAGNPFFLAQFLEKAHRDGLLTRDERSGAWAWDLARIQASSSAENVVEFVLSRLQTLAPETQRALRLAACIGHQFDLRTLSLIGEQDPRRTMGDLWPALRDGFIHPLDPEYRFLHPSPEGEGAPPEALSFDVDFRFVHDRVQQAAYLLIEEGQRQRVHLSIGRLMRERMGRAERDEGLFDVVEHLNFGAPLINDPDERRELAALNLEVGRKAHGAAAYEAAAGYFKAGMSVLGEAGWETDHALAFALHVECAESSCLAGAFVGAESLFPALGAHARTTLELGRVGNLKVMFFSMTSRPEEAVKECISWLRVFGVEIPEDGGRWAAAVEDEFSEMARSLGGRSIPELIELPLDDDPVKRAMVKLLSTASQAAAFVDRHLLALLALKQVNTSLRYGHTELSPRGYMLLGLYLSGWLGRHREAAEFGMLALALNDRKFKRLDMTCRLNHNMSAHIYFYREPLRPGFVYFRRAYEAGIECGDHSYLPFVTLHTPPARLDLGEELGTVEEEVDRFMALVQRTKNAMIAAFQRVNKQFIAALTGRTNALCSLSSEQFDEAEFLEEAERSRLTYVVCLYYTVKTQLLYLYGDHAGALAMAREGESRLVSSMGFYYTTVLAFYMALTLLALLPDKDAGEQARRAEELARCMAKVETWATGCRANFEHKRTLLLAEAARAGGRDLEAMELYERAIQAARDADFPRDEALASELAGRFFLAKGLSKAARGYLRDAHYGVVRWGATAKAAELAARYPSLLGTLPEAATESRLPAAVTTMISGVGVAVMDASAVLRLAQTIASDSDLDRVLRRWMDVALGSSGAQRGVLLLDQGGDLAPVLAVSLDRGGEGDGRVPMSVVQYVQRTGEPLLVGDLTRDLLFAGDPYVVERSPRSVLCLPMVYRERVTGLVYLETNVGAEVFSSARTKLCELLTSQAALAIENATMTSRLQRVNKDLEIEVAARTEELRVANEHLEQQLVERAKAEAARAALQEEVIRVQRERLSELSAPMIPITEKVMVMPLIGTMDAARAEQIAKAALHGAAATRAAVLIVDITGITQFDRSLATAVVQTASALRLLGAEVVVTGVRPEVAQALVRLNEPLGLVATMGTLQSGIRHALERTRELLPVHGRARSVVQK
jgi:predicted ATPase/GAF domain-containing protein/anti-anti-sigma regulatory factor